VNYSFKGVENNTRPISIRKAVFLKLVFILMLSQKIFSSVAHIHQTLVLLLFIYIMRILNMGTMFIYPSPN